jgi:alpha-tubulin suppressor-like RCC1 family protein
VDAAVVDSPSDIGHDRPVNRDVADAATDVGMPTDGLGDAGDDVTRDRPDASADRSDGACSSAECREIRAVYATGQGTVVVRADGTTRYWGNWQLQFNRPFRGPTIPPGAVVAATEFLACALWEDASLRCWGAGLGGLGRGDGGDELRMSVSAEPLLADIRQLGLFAVRRCAVNSRAEMYCWGEGDTSGIQWPTPVRQPLPSGFSRFATCQDGLSVCYHTLDGSVRCGVTNFVGPSGECAATPPPDPVEIPEIHGALSVSLGRPGGCAVLADARVSCWAYNQTDFSVLPSPTGNRCLQRPVVVPGLAGVAEVGMGYEHVCALLLDGSVSCFGRNSAGQLGLGSIDNERMYPVAPVAGLPPVAQLAVGSAHNCALTRDHRLFCWGVTSLRTPATDPQPTPTEVVFPD